MFNPVLFGTLSHVHLPHILPLYSYKNNCHFIIDVYNILCCGGFLSHELLCQYIVKYIRQVDHVFNGQTFLLFQRHRPQPRTLHQAHRRCH